MPADPDRKDSIECLPAPNTNEVILLHLGYRLPKDTSYLLEHLNSVSHVILCGSFHRARRIAEEFSTLPAKNFCCTDRYLLLQPIPSVLVAAHGIGIGSIDVLLHEIYVALKAAQASDWCFIRTGSCGGLGVPPGTLVVTRRPLGGDLTPSLRMFVLGEDKRYNAQLDKPLSESLFQTGLSKFGGSCVRGDTLCAETFHIAQGRHDGAFVPYTNRDKLDFFERCRDVGVVNLEMESLPLAAFASMVNVPTAVVCVVLVDRLRFETPTDDGKTIAEFEQRCITLVVDFVLSRISRSQ
ncbi:uridine phosphorylase 2 [Gracilaria domingensis]|nr:uridine phosphorylase 2 [Gracilaria domingensis]